MQVNLLPNPLGVAQKNTYPFDWTINVKLPFDSALSRLIILQEYNEDYTSTLTNMKNSMRKTNMVPKNVTHQSSDKQSLIWISRNIWVIIWVICTETDIRKTR